MNSKIFGGVLLIVGTSLGAGMLAAPLVTAAGGYIHSLLLFFGTWLLTVFAAYCLLEVNLWLPEKTNLISMAKRTLGVPGQVLTWIVYLLLLYSLLSAYIAGGSDLLHGILSGFHVSTPRWLDCFAFTIVLGAIVFNEIAAVDWANRFFMILKMGSYLILVMLIAPHVHWGLLEGGHIRLLSSAVMVVVTAFGYSVIIPSLRPYFNSDVKALRTVIGLGSLLSLFCYLAWDLVVQGSLQSIGAGGLIEMSVSGHATSALTSALSTRLHSPVISDVAHVFTSVCVTTSFLGVALCLSDFLKDGLRLHELRIGRWLATMLTFLPPVMVVLFYPGAFIVGLKYAGVLCVLLLIFIPMLMTWSGRYIRKIADGYAVFGGKPLLVFSMMVSLLLFVYGVVELMA